MKIISTAAAILLLMILIACNAKSNHKEIDSLRSEVNVADEKKYNETPGNGFTAVDSSGSPAPQDEPGKKKQPTSQPVPNPDWDKKIIKTANLELEVKDYNSFYANTREKIRNVGGYVAQEEQQQSDYKLENALTIKVPVDQFDNALAQITSGVEKINEKKVTSQDVTSEYIDTRSRIEAKKQVRLRYMDLLKQAKNMEEILSVQSEINGIQEEIESATGRVEYLGHSAAYSTINLTFYQVLNSSAKENENPGFGTKLGAAFRSGWHWVRDLFVELVSIWPLFIVILFGLALYRRYRSKKIKQA